MRYIIAILLAMAPVAVGAAEVLDRAASPEVQQQLRALIASDRRSDGHKARDKYRHPLKTLTFFGIDPSSTVVEIWPGGQGGWYREIIEPLMAEKGRYIPLGNRSDFPDDVDFVPYGEVDMVLVFRAHGFTIYDPPAQKHVDALYKMLRPGGIFGIVDHAGDESVPQDPAGENGYVNQSYFTAMAEKAGFKLLAEAAINRNPQDDKHHPDGVYSLPPSLRGSLPLTDARQKWLAIGESDRFTLKFYKPLGAASTVQPQSSRQKSSRPKFSR